MENIIITDLTRFKDPVHVCVAGLTLDGQTCIRPMKEKGVGPSNPYLTYDRCKLEGILPGAIVEADFKDNCNKNGPHTEDQHYGTLRVVRQADVEEFCAVLNYSASATLSDGFGVPVTTKYIPISGAIPTRSIITLALHPSQVDIDFSFNKVRANFSDGSGVQFSGVPVNDLGIVNYFKRPDASSIAFTKTIQRARYIFARVGVGRQYAVPDGRDGYWLQINGIYTFPDIPHNIRGALL